MEREVTFRSGDVTLAGSLVVPDAPRAVVVLAHGSGPLDRDENTPATALNVFNDLAARLDGAGIASLRYDKRGIGGSGGEFASAGQNALAADLLAAARFSMAEVPAPLHLCGHSEGTYLVARVAREAGAAGLILVCPYLQRGDAVLMAQAARVEATIRAMPGLRGWLARRWLDLRGWPVATQARFIERMKDSTAATLRQGGQDVPVTWLRDFALCDPAEAHGGHDLPTLILPAEFDAQCDPADGAAIAALGPNRTVTMLPALSHILRRTGRADVADYARQLGEPIAPAVGQLIIDWMNRQIETRDAEPGHD